MNNATVVSATVKARTFIVWPRPEMQRDYRAVFTMGDGSERDCAHSHRSEATAGKCARRAVRTGSTWK